MKDIFNAQSEAHKISLATEDHNLRAAAFASRVDGVLGALRETVSHKPQLLEVSLQKGLDALRANRESLGLTDEALQTQETVFERDLLTEAARTRIGRGESASIFKELQDPEMRAMFGEAAADQLAQEAEARQISEVTAILSSLDIHTEAIANTGTGIEGLTAEAEAKLSPDELTTYRARERAAQEAHRFGRRLEHAPRSALEADLETAFPGELASEEDNDSFDAVRNKMTAMLKERDTNPGAVAGRDPVVAALRRTGNEEQAASLALAIQKRMEVPPEARKVVATEEARREAAALDGGLIVERPSQILKLKEKYGRHFDAVLDQMRAEGLDPETAAMAAVVDNPKALQTLMQTVGVPHAKLTEGKTPEEIAAVRSAIAAEQETLEQQGRLSPGIDAYIYEKAALRIYEQTGNPALAAKRAVKTFVEPEGTANGDDTLLGGAEDDVLAIDQTEDQAKTEANSSTKNANSTVGSAEDVGADDEATVSTDREATASQGGAAENPEEEHENNDLGERELRIQTTGCELIEDLRTISLNNKRLTKIELSARKREIEENYSFHTGFQILALAILEGSQLDKRDVDGEKRQLALLESAVNNPETLQAQSVSKAFRDKFSKADREKIWEQRSIPRKERDDSFVKLMEAVSNLEENRQILNSLEKAGKPTLQTLTVLRKKIANMESTIPVLIKGITEASQKLAGLPTTPFPGVDQFLAREQETIEIRDERLKRLAVDIAITAGSFASRKLSEFGFIGSRTATGISFGANALQSTIAFSRSFDDRLSKLLTDSNIDVTNFEAVRKFANDQKERVEQITTQAILDAISTSVSIEASRRIAKKANLGFIDERALRPPLRKQTDEVFDLGFPEED